MQSRHNAPTPSCIAYCEEHSITLPSVSFLSIRFPFATCSITLPNAFLGESSSPFVCLVGLSLMQ